MFFGCERGYQLRTYEIGGDGGSCKMRPVAYKGRECHTSCVLGITRNWTYELPNELSNGLRLTILENEKVLRLFTWVFID